MENIFSICNQLKSVSKVKKQLLLNKPFKLIVDNIELGSYIFRASGDVYISKDGDISSGFFQINEQSEKIQIEYQKQIFVYDIIFMNEVILVTNSSQGVVSIFLGDSNIENVEEYLNGLTLQPKPAEESIASVENNINETQPTSQKKSSNKILIFIISTLIIISLLFYFFINKKANDTLPENDLKYKQIVLKIYENLNLRKDDSVFYLYADTINYYGKINTLKSDAVIDYRNLITNVIQDFKLTVDTMSIVVTSNNVDSTVIVTGIVIQKSTLIKNSIPYTYRSNFEYRFNRFGKINFINATVTQKDIDYNTIIGSSDSELIFSNEIQASEFLVRNFGRLYDMNFNDDYRNAISIGLVKKIGSNKIVFDYNSPSRSFKFADFVDSLVANKFILKNLNRVILSNGMISELSVTIDNLESATTAEISSAGYYFINATNDNLVYFYTSPNEIDKKQSYFNSREQVYVSSIENGFGYIEFTNNKGQTSKGWIRLQDLSVN